MKSKYHVVIVGSGIGGLSAAATLAGHGLDILMVDENSHFGGQLLRRSENRSTPFLKVDTDGIKAKGFSLLGKTSGVNPTIDKLNQAQVLGVFRDRRLLIHTGTMKGEAEKPWGRMMEIQAECLILATGARERYLPFKGWTLPGVMSLGAAQILMKTHGVLPGFPAVIAGSSPLMLALGSEMVNNGGKVTAVLDENSFFRKLGFLSLIRHHWPKLLEGAFYTGQMMWNRVPVMNQTRIIEARGKERFESVVVAKTTLQGQVIKGSEREYAGDVLTIGYGFVPNIELAVQAGCDIDYQPSWGGWVVKADHRLESSVDSIFAVGEITGIAGGKKSYLQGKLAAISVLGKFDKLNRKKRRLFSKHVKHLHALNDQQASYAAFLNHLCRLPTAAYQQIQDDTLICRCENITMGTIKKFIRQGFVSSGGLKKAARCGMGRCQGRICGPIVQDILMALTEQSPYDIKPALSRAPVKNVAVRSFLDEFERKGTPDDPAV